MALQSEIAVGPQSPGLEWLISGYRPLHGVFDEMMDGDGRVRPHWQSFLAMLAALGADEINRRFAAADRYLRDSGVFYRVYEDAAGIERPWPLSHIPLIIDPSEWRQLAAGLTQRAELLEALLADSYGPGALTREGRLPAAHGREMHDRAVQALQRVAQRLSDAGAPEGFVERRDVELQRARVAARTAEQRCERCVFL